MDALPDLVGSGDVARALRLTRQAVDYRFRNDPQAPDPVGVINRTSSGGGVRVWRRTDVEKWLGPIPPERWRV